MKQYRNVIIVVALATVTFILTAGFLVSARRTVPVVVAARPLAVGTRLQAEDVTVRQIPARAVLPGAFSDVQDVLGRVVTAQRLPGDQITTTVLGEKAISALAASLAPDHVAMAVRVTRAQALAGLLRPGDRVTVIGIIDPSDLNLLNPIGGLVATGETGSERLSPAARIVLRGIRVLFVPRTFRYEESTDRDQMALLASTSTAAREGEIVLDVPLEGVELYPGGPVVGQAELLALLNARGEIHLALENPDASAMMAGMHTPGARLFDIAQAFQITTTLPVTATGQAEAAPVSAEEGSNDGQ